MSLLYTIGHSNHSLSQLISILRQYEINIVADVRRHPYSRHNPQFNQPSLMAGLQNAGIEYRFLGNKLGGKDDFDKIKARPEFEEGINELTVLASQGSHVAILCAEEDPYHCHRHHILEPAFNKNNVKIVHIRGNGQPEMIRQMELFAI